jgi:hypothetical protein
MLNIPLLIYVFFLKEGSNIFWDLASFMYIVSLHNDSLLIEHGTIKANKRN